MAAGAEFAAAIEVLHDRLGVAIEVCEDLLIGDLAVDGLVIFIDQHSWLSENIASGATGIDFLNGVADRTGDAVLIELAIDGRALGERPGGERGGVMAALASVA